MAVSTPNQNSLGLCQPGSDECVFYLLAGLLQSLDSLMKNPVSISIVVRIVMRAGADYVSISTPAQGVTTIGARP